MSMDTVNDLHYAEDGAADLARALRRVVAAVRRADAPDVVDDAAHVLRGWDAYCRPTCRAEGGQDECEAADDECGCRCHDRWAVGLELGLGLLNLLVDTFLLPDTRDGKGER